MPPRASATAEASEIFEDLTSRPPCVVILQVSFDVRQSFATGNQPRKDKEQEKTCGDSSAARPTAMVTEADQLKSRKKIAAKYKNCHNEFKQRALTPFL